MMRHVAIVVLALSIFVPRATAQDDEEVAIKHFESTVLPILKANCYKCHGAGDVKAGLRISDQESLLEGGESGPAVDLGDLDKSILLNAINYQDYEMPPKGKLAQSQIDAITQWVKAGAPYPDSMLEPADDEEAGGPPPVNEKTKSWWSFQPVKRPAVPSGSKWGTNAIDHFIAAKLSGKGLKPNAQADKVTLLRRAYYDLIGLPPTPEQVKAFIADDSDKAFENVIDQLLASEHYGEKWGRHWLDLVRYGETNSYERDGAKPYVWRYRDYVIQSFNDDKPYDKFITEQLAGDEIENPTPESVIATGYYRLGIWQDEPVDKVESMYNDLDDILVTTTDTFLGLTVGCARCHDHKIDPIPQKDYYRMLAFFRNIRRYGVRGNDSVLQASVMEVDQPAEDKELNKDQRKHDEQLNAAKREMKNLEEEVRKGLDGVEAEDFVYEMNRLAIMKKHSDKNGKKLINAGRMRHYESLRRRRQQLEANPPSGLAKALCVKETGKTSPKTFLLTRGNAHAEGEEVTPGFPSVLSPPEPDIVAPKSNTTGRRLALAKWIGSKDNPLTARVIVNRIWQHHFGRGIVRSTSDYGFQGTPATHVKLLDWLAAEFVEGGWTMKRMHKMIMLSDTYRMSSDRQNTDAIAKDEANDYMWRFDSRRLIAEEVRDSILAINGRLNTKMFGPSIYPKVPQEVLHGLSRPGAGWPTSRFEDQQRRSIYVHVKRSLPLPMLASFDIADPDKPCPVRFVTTQPTQALGMLNSRFINDQAKALAESVKEAAGDDVEAQVTLALWRTKQREPSKTDVARGLKLMKELRDEDKASADDALKYLCLVSLNLNEFMYLD